MGLLALVLLLLLLAGVIITGGAMTKRAVEVYNSVSQNTCSLENLKKDKNFHTLCGGLLCGAGKGSQRNNRCMKWDANTYKFSFTDLKLKGRRTSSLCWPVDNEGILLLGGHPYKCRTEYVKADASDSCESFHLRNPAE